MIVIGTAVVAMLMMCSSLVSGLAFARAGRGN